MPKLSTLTCVSTRSEAVQQVLDYKPVTLSYRQVPFLSSVEESGDGGAVQQLKHIHCCYFVWHLQAKHTILQSGGLCCVALTPLI